MSWKQEKVQNKVDVKLFRGHKPYIGQVGTMTLNGKLAFGIVDSEDHMTFMCYYLDTMSPEDMVFLSSEYGWWCFHSGAQIKIRQEELERALTSLGLIK